MKKLFLIVFLAQSLLGIGQSNEESDSLVEYVSKHSKEVYQAIIVEGDTIPIVLLNEVLFIDKPKFTTEDAKRRYYILQRKVIKVYPYAVIAGNKLDSLNIELRSIKSKRKRKRYTKKLQKYLEEEFEPRLRKLTRTEGQILSKLVYRETGLSSFDLISKYRSNWNAFWWNVVANYYDISLKTPYAPQSVEEDKLIENILQRSFAKGLLKEREPFSEYPTTSVEQDE